MVSSSHKLGERWKARAAASRVVPSAVASPASRVVNCARGSGCTTALCFSVFSGTVVPLSISLGRHTPSSSTDKRALAFHRPRTLIPCRTGDRGAITAGMKRHNGFDRAYVRTAALRVSTGKRTTQAGRQAGS
jgi:hypothetical protein